MRIYKTIIYYVRLLRLQFIKYKHRKYLTTSANKGGMKSFVGSDYTMIFNSTFENKKEQVEKIVETIVKKSKNDPNKLLAFVEKNETKVFRNKFAKKILALIDETEGFIVPKKGVKALYLNLILNKKISLTFEGCFLVNEIDPYSMIHQFYTWFCFKSGFAGYEFSAQEKFNKLINCKNPKSYIDDFSIADILSVKEAMHRDVEAINFVIKLTKNSEGAKAAFQKLKTSTACL